MRSTPTYFHGGDIGGHSALWAHWPNLNNEALTVAFICNNGDSALSLLPRATAIANVIEGNGPHLPISSTPPAAGVPALGRSYTLDMSAAYQTAATAHTFLPLGHLTGTLSLEVVAVRGGQITFALHQSGRSQPTTLVANYSDPSFETRPASVSLETSIGTVDVDDLVIKGHFVDQTKRIGDVGIAAEVDLRQARRLVGLSTAELCPMRDGNRCHPCDDRIRACVSVDYRGIVNP